MSVKSGPEGVDFQGKRGVNAGDALHDRDLVTLRQLRRGLANFTGSTVSGGSASITSIGQGYPVYAGLNGSNNEFRSFSAYSPNLILYCGDTITYGLNDNLIITGLTASTLTADTIFGGQYFSGDTPLELILGEKLWTASTGNQSIVRNNYTNNIATGSFSLIGGSYSHNYGNFSSSKFLFLFM